MKKEDPHRYDDMVGMERPPHFRPPMDRAARAAQFAPFQALTGYGDVLEDTAREHLLKVEQELVREPEEGQETVLEEWDGID